MKYIIEVKAKDGTWRQYKSYDNYVSAWFHNLFELCQAKFIRWLWCDRVRAYKDINENRQINLFTQCLVCDTNHIVNLVTTVANQTLEIYK